jgi:hypothetical protein
VINANPQTLPGFGLIQSLRPVASAEEQEQTLLRRMIWLYFVLLIVEGALRKWALPSLSAPLLVIRDPLVLLIYVQALRCRRFPASGPMVAYFLLLTSFMLLALFQIMAGIGGGPLVAAYGLRTDFLHLPLIFVIPQAFSQADVVKLGKWVLMLSIPMAGLMVLQFSSAPDSWINAATSVDVKQIDFVMGKIRPAGTFSFATGAAHFFVLATAFLVYALAEERAVYSRWLVWAALFSVAIIQPVSGSRTLVLGCALELVAAIAFGILNPRRAHRIFAMALLICAAVAALSMTGVFQEAITAFMTRWDNASNNAGGIQEGLVWRFFGAFLEPMALLPVAGLLGRGLGVGTGAGATLMTGAPQFLLAENEWPRVVLESGSLLGFSFLAYRVWVACRIALGAAAAARGQQLLPWLLAWYACRTLVTESISQPTNLGFMVLVSGLSLAAISRNRLGVHIQ